MRRERKWEPMKSRFRLSILLMAGSALSAGCQPARTPVRVWQGTLTLPTYQEGTPDPNPPFDLYQTNSFNYPYTLRTNLTGVKSDHAWRAVFLENEYLRCSVLPDIGGHLYTCIDKTSGQPMFYANPSIKKAEIGYRGAWAAFGIEFNFPISHNWVSMSPVDFAYGAHEDGSASVWVGNIDRPYGMQWQVELVMKPASSLLEERVTLFNRSDVRHRYYWWNNAGIQVWDDSRVEYPMQFVASHGFTEVDPWPVDAKGKDLSVIANETDGAVSLFVHGSREPFMGVWNPHTQTGTVHYANYSDLPGKKIWSWGVDRDGLGWRTALSDNNSAYVEVQAGLFRNQETYAFLEPGKTVHFSEFWMPVRGTGGISRANKTGVVHLDLHNGNVAVALNVNERLPGAQIALSQNGASLWAGTADLAPETTWSHTVAVNGREGKVTFELKDRAGRSLLKQTDGEYDWDPQSSIATGPQAIEQVPEPALRSEDDWLQVGRNQELGGKAVVASATYRSALEKYPQSQSLEIAAGRLAATLQRFDEAERLLRQAQKRDTPNSEIAYYLGIAEEGLGLMREAQTSYEIAFRQADLRSPAAVRLGELRAREGDLEGAESFLKAALATEPANSRAQEELEAVVRALGEPAEADRLAHLDLKENPLSAFLEEDAGKPDLGSLAADPYRVLRIASEYMRLGLFEKALNLLDRTYSQVSADRSEPGSVLPQEHPLVRYYAAYCKQKLGASAQSDWQAASQLSTNLVFPSSDTDRVVLQAALDANGKDATAHYLLGTLLFSKGLIDEGMAHWARSRQLAPRRPVIDVDMGNALLNVKDDPQGALTAFHEGIGNDPKNPAVYVGLDESMSVTGASAVERADALSQYPSADASDSKMPAGLVYQLALTRAEAGQYERALALFNDRFFPSEEGGTTSEQVLFEVKLMQAEAWAASHNCAQAESMLAGVRPAAGAQKRSAREYLRLAAIAQNCGRANESRDLFEKAAAETDLADLAWTIQAQRALGTYDAAKTGQRLTASLAEAQRNLAASTHSGYWEYTVGMLEAALDQKEQARESFARTLVLADTHMSHHLAREALAELAQGK